MDHLRAFCVLATSVERGDRGAFTRAASELALDVSVLRRRMQTLATYIGAPLVEGRGNRLRLTPAGARARTHAVRTLEAAAELAAVAQDDAQSLRVACTGTIFGELLPPVLRTIRDAYPKLRFRVHRAGAEASRRLLASDEVDFAVVRGGDRPSGMSSLRLGADRLWLAMPSASPLAKTRRLSMAAVAREPLIGYTPDSSTMRRVMAVLGPHGAEPWLEVDRKSAALAYVAAGLGVAFVSAMAAQRPERAGVALRDVTPAFEPVAFWLVWRQAAALPPPHRRFIDDLRATASRVPPAGAEREERQKK